MTISGKEIANKILNGEVVEIKKENVSKNQHYNQGNIECIDYIKDNLTSDMYEGFLVGNVIKYISRYRYKKGVEDLKKAEVYLKWLIKELEE